MLYRLWNSTTQANTWQLAIEEAGTWCKPWRKMPEIEVFGSWLHASSGSEVPLVQKRHPTTSWFGVAPASMLGARKGYLFSTKQGAYIHQGDFSLCRGHAIAKPS
jgi:hypothetical protein